MKLKKIEIVVNSSRAKFEFKDLEVPDPVALFSTIERAMDLIVEDLKKGGKSEAKDL